MQPNLEATAYFDRYRDALVIEAAFGESPDLEEVVQSNVDLGTAFGTEIFFDASSLFGVEGGSPLATPISGQPIIIKIKGKHHTYTTTLVTDNDGQISQVFDRNTLRAYLHEEPDEIEVIVSTSYNGKNYEVKNDVVMWRVGAVSSEAPFAYLFSTAVQEYGKKHPEICLSVFLLAAFIVVSSVNAGRDILAALDLIVPRKGILKKGFTDYSIAAPRLKPFDVNSWGKYMPYLKYIEKKDGKYVWNLAKINADKSGPKLGRALRYVGRHSTFLSLALLGGLAVKGVFKGVKKIYHKLSKSGGAPPKKPEKSKTRTRLYSVPGGLIAGMWKIIKSIADKVKERKASKKAAKPAEKPSVEEDAVADAMEAYRENVAQAEDLADMVHPGLVRAQMWLLYHVGRVLYALRDTTLGFAVGVWLFEAVVSAFEKIMDIAKEIQHSKYTHNAFARVSDHLIEFMKRRFVMAFVQTIILDRVIEAIDDGEKRKSVERGRFISEIIDRTLVDLSIVYLPNAVMREYLFRQVWEQYKQGTLFEINDIKLGEEEEATIRDYLNKGKYEEAKDELLEVFRKRLGFVKSDEKEKVQQADQSEKIILLQFDNEEEAKKSLDTLRELGVSEKVINKLQKLIEKGKYDKVKEYVESKILPDLIYEGIGKQILNTKANANLQNLPADLYRLLGYAFVVAKLSLLGEGAPSASQITQVSGAQTAEQLLHARLNARFSEVFRALYAIATNDPSFLKNVKTLVKNPNFNLPTKPKSFKSWIKRVLSSVPGKKSLQGALQYFFGDNAEMIAGVVGNDFGVFANSAARFSALLARDQDMKEQFLIKSMIHTFKNAFPEIFEAKEKVKQIDTEVNELISMIVITSTIADKESDKNRRWLLEEVKRLFEHDEVEQLVDTAQIGLTWIPRQGHDELQQRLNRLNGRILEKLQDKEVYLKAVRRRRELAVSFAKAFLEYLKSQFESFDPDSQLAIVETFVKHRELKHLLKIDEQLRGTWEEIKQIKDKGKLKDKLKDFFESLYNNEQAREYMHRFLSAKTLKNISILIGETGTPKPLLEITSDLLFDGERPVVRSGVRVRVRGRLSSKLKDSLTKLYLLEPLFEKIYSIHHHITKLQSYGLRNVAEARRYVFTPQFLGRLDELINTVNGGNVEFKNLFTDPKTLHPMAIMISWMMHKQSPIEERIGTDWELSKHGIDPWAVHARTMLEAFARHNLNEEQSKEFAFPAEWKKDIENYQDRVVNVSQELWSNKGIHTILAAIHEIDRIASRYNNRSLEEQENIDNLIEKYMEKIKAAAKEIMGDKFKNMSEDELAAMLVFTFAPQSTLTKLIGTQKGREMFNTATAILENGKLSDIDTARKYNFTEHWEMRAAFFGPWKAALHWMAYDVKKGLDESLAGRIDSYEIEDHRGMEGNTPFQILVNGMAKIDWTKTAVMLAKLARVKVISNIGHYNPRRLDGTVFDWGVRSIGRGLSQPLLTVWWESKKTGEKTQIKFMAEDIGLREIVPLTPVQEQVFSKNPKLPFYLGGDPNQALGGYDGNTGLSDEQMALFLENGMLVYPYAAYPYLLTRKEASSLAKIDGLYNSSTQYAQWAHDPEAYYNPLEYGTQASVMALQKDPGKYNNNVIGGIGPDSDLKLVEWIKPLISGDLSVKAVSPFVDPDTVGAFGADTHLVIVDMDASALPREKIREAAAHLDSKEQEKINKLLNEIDRVDTQTAYRKIEEIKRIFKKAVSSGRKAKLGKDIIKQFKNIINTIRRIRVNPYRPLSKRYAIISTSQGIMLRPLESFNKVAGLPETIEVLSSEEEAKLLAELRRLEGEKQRLEKEWGLLGVKKHKPQIGPSVKASKKKIEKRLAELNARIEKLRARLANAKNIKRLYEAAGAGVVLDEYSGRLAEIEKEISSTREIIGLYERYNTLSNKIENLQKKITAGSGGGDDDEINSLKKELEKLTNKAKQLGVNLDDPEGYKKAQSRLENLQKAYQKTFGEFDELTRTLLKEVKTAHGLPLDDISWMSAVGGIWENPEMVQRGAVAFTGEFYPTGWWDTRLSPLEEAVLYVASRASQGNLRQKLDQVMAHLNLGRTQEARAIMEDIIRQIYSGGFGGDPEKRARILYRAFLRFVGDPKRLVKFIMRGNIRALDRLTERFVKKIKKGQIKIDFGDGKPWDVSKLPTEELKRLVTASLLIGSGVDIKNLSAVFLQNVFGVPVFKTLSRNESTFMIVRTKGGAIPRNQLLTLRVLGPLHLDTTALSIFYAGATKRGRPVKEPPLPWAIKMAFTHAYSRLGQHNTARGDYRSPSHRQMEKSVTIDPRGAQALPDNPSDMFPAEYFTSPFLGLGSAAANMIEIPHTSILSWIYGDLFGSIQTNWPGGHPKGVPGYSNLRTAMKSEAAIMGELSERATKASSRGLWSFLTSLGAAAGMTLGLGWGAIPAQIITTAINGGVYKATAPNLTPKQRIGRAVLGALTGAALGAASAAAGLTAPIWVSAGFSALAAVTSIRSWLKQRVSKKETMTDVVGRQLQDMRAHKEPLYLHSGKSPRPPFYGPGQPLPIWIRIGFEAYRLGDYLRMLYRKLSLIQHAYLTPPNMPTVLTPVRMAVSPEGAVPDLNAAFQLVASRSFDARGPFSVIWTNEKQALGLAGAIFSAPAAYVLLAGLLGVSPLVAFTVSGIVGGALVVTSFNKVRRIRMPPEERAYLKMEESRKITKEPIVFTNEQQWGVVNLSQDGMPYTLSMGSTSPKMADTVDWEFWEELKRKKRKDEEEEKKKEKGEWEWIPPAMIEQQQMEQQIWQQPVIYAGEAPPGSAAPPRDTISGGGEVNGNGAPPA